MNILHTVESYDPSKGGMQEVVKQISERLVKMGHSVTVATSKNPARTSYLLNGVRIIDFDLSGNLVRGIQGDIELYKSVLLNPEYDIVTNFAAQQWATDIALPLLNEIKGKKIFVPTGFSALCVPEFSEYFEKMKVWLTQYDINIFLSNTYQDIEFARKNGIHNYIIIPNGASSEEFLIPKTVDIRKKLGISKTQFLVLHVGSHTNIKGHAETIEIFSRANINNSTLVIVGEHYLEGCSRSCTLKEYISLINPLNFIRNKRIIVCYLDRQQTVALYLTSDLFLFPSNIECSPIVLFECMASKTPFLTTDVGNAAEIIEWSHAGELLPTKKDSRGYSHADITQSVKILENLYYDSQRRTTMQSEGFNKWHENFTWEIIAEKYEDIYKKVIERGSS